MSYKVFSEYYRGFKDFEIDINRATFLVGDNSSGKSSILYLLNFVLDTGLSGSPRLAREANSDKYDFFSPYFNYRDVTIGAIYDGADLDQQDASYAKVITLKRTRLGAPNVTKCTYLTNRFSLYIRAADGQVEAEVGQPIAHWNGPEVRRLHHARRRFKRVKTGRRTAVNDPLIAIACLGQLAPDTFDPAGPYSEAFGTEFGSSRLLSSVRGGPEKYYSFDRTYREGGTHFASMLRDLSLRDPGLQDPVLVAFGRDSSLFESVSVDELSRKITNPPMVVLVQRNGKQFSLDQVGVGVSQILPIVTELIFAKQTRNSPIFLIQQPELHLHPVAQAAFGELLYEFCRDIKSGIVIETHSDFIIDRFRSKIRDAHDEYPHSQLIYCSSGEGGNIIRQIEIDEDGKLQGAPSEYFSFFMNEISRTFF